MKNGATFESGPDYCELVDGFLCTFRTVNRRWYRPFLGYAGWYYRGAEFPVLQLIWPDKQHHYPWHPGFNPSFVWAQPLLFEQDPVQARVERVLESMDEE
jgi:hypothetical protein